VKSALENSTSVWPHRWAVALVCATFPLIWVGGLVTTYQAGMAVPDWPNTYGYNLFLYPWQTWLFGPWDLFIEHGHRLLGALVGLLAIGLVVSAWRTKQSRSVKAWSVLALVAVIGQGVLGGLRVVLDERLLAMIHGCVGPAFFALCAALTAITAPCFTTANNSEPRIARIHRLALLTAALAYLQIVFGAAVRHLPPGAEPEVFRVAMFAHLFMAAALSVHIVLLGIRSAAAPGPLRRPALALTSLLLVQVLLGCGAWVTNYGWPSWIGEHAWSESFVVQAEGGVQALITTAHQATGSLILALSVLAAVRSAGAPVRSPALSLPSSLAGVAA
jgi:cytochrome c oxidase assembly protein subunit 15